MSSHWSVTLPLWCCCIFWSFVYLHIFVKNIYFFNTVIFGFGYSQVHPEFSVAKFPFGAPLILFNVRLQAYSNLTYNTACTYSDSDYPAVLLDWRVCRSKHYQSFGEYHRHSCFLFVFPFFFF